MRLFLKYCLESFVNFIFMFYRKRGCMGFASTFYNFISFHFYTVLILSCFLISMGLIWICSFQLRMVHRDHITYFSIPLVT